MSTNMVKFRHGTYRSYLNLVQQGNVEENALYFITDEGNARLYKGSKLFTQQWEVVPGLPAADDAKTDRLYIDTVGNKLAYFNGSTFSDVLKGSDITVSTTVAENDVNAVSSHAVFTFVKDEILKLTGGIDLGTVVTGIETAEGTPAGSFTVKQGKTSTDVTLNGVVVNPEWDATTRILTLPNTTTGKELTINFGKDMVITSGEYDATNKKLIFVIGEDATKTVEVPVGDLIDVYTASTETDGAIKLTVTDNAFKGELLVDSASVLKITAGKLTADLSGYVTTTIFDTLNEAVTNLQKDVKKNSDNIVALNAFLNGTEGDTLNARIDARIKDTKDKAATLEAQISNLEEAYKNADAGVLADAKTYAKNYTDTQIESAKTLWVII